MTMFWLARNQTFYFQTLVGVVQVDKEVIIALTEMAYKWNQGTVLNILELGVENSAFFVSVAGHTCGARLCFKHNITYGTCDRARPELFWIDAIKEHVHQRDKAPDGCIGKSTS